jgi:hypothetical protein
MLFLMHIECETVMQSKGIADLVTRNLEIDKI